MSIADFSKYQCKSRSLILELDEHTLNNARNKLRTALSAWSSHYNQLKGSEGKGKGKGKLDQIDKLKKTIEKARPENVEDLAREADIINRQVDVFINEMHEEKPRWVEKLKQFVTATNSLVRIPLETVQVIHS